MKTEQILMCLFALILGMLIANMLKDVCGCNILEGQNPPSVPYLKTEASKAKERAKKAVDRANVLNNTAEVARQKAKESSKEDKAEADKIASMEKKKAEVARRNADRLGEIAEEAVAAVAAAKAEAEAKAVVSPLPPGNKPVNLVDMGSFKLKCINGDIYGVLD